MNSLWGNFNLETIKTPSSILDEVIKDLKDMTQNIIYAELISNSNTDTDVFDILGLGSEFTFRFLIKSKYMDNYSFEAFSIYHNVLPYPLNMKIDSEISNSIKGELTNLNKDISKAFISINSEEEFLKILSFILQSKRMKEIINMLYTLAKENLKTKNYKNNSSEKGFICNGSTTREAIEFYERYKDEFGEVIEAEMIADSNKVKYILILTNNSDEKMVFLSGLTSGYLGEGCRGTQKVLNMAGFDVSGKFISNNISFIISK